MANSKEPHWPGNAFPLNAITVRKSRIAKPRVAHLFVEYTNGAVSGHAISFCGVYTWPNTKNAAENWQEADSSTPLCNHCGRSFHRERKDWVGEP
jgi:hypothetical protein